MVSSTGVSDDERRARRLADEARGRIADLGSGWTAAGDAIPDPEGPTTPDPAPSGAAPPDAPSRPRTHAPVSPPRATRGDALASPVRSDAPASPAHAARAGGAGSAVRDAHADAPASPVRAATDDGDTVDDVAHFDDFDDVATRRAVPFRPAAPPATRPPPLPSGARARTPVPAPASKRPRAGQQLDLRGLPEADKTKENRGAVGVRNAHSGALTTNAVSGTIADETPIFDRVAIAAGPRAGRSPSMAAPLRAPLPVSVGDARTETAPAPSSPYAKPSSSLISIKSIRIDRSAAAELDDTRIPPPVSRATVAPAPGSFMIGGATFHDASGSLTEPIELPTADPVGDEIVAAVAASPGGPDRSVAALRCKRGLAGDLRYVATVVFGLRRARRELAQLEVQHAKRAQARRSQLVVLATAAVSDRIAHPAVEPARVQLAQLDDERAQHVERVADGDAELDRVRGDRDAHAAQYAVDVPALDAELAGLADQVAPLVKAVAAHRRRAAALRDSIDQLDARIARTEASLANAKTGKLDVAATQARLAALTADRAALRRDEPATARALDALYPQIATLEAARGELQRRRAARVTAERDDQARADEVRAAIAARRKVLERAAADADALRAETLRALGERLATDRPAALADALGPIDDLDQERSLAERRALELQETVASVDRWKLARGIALLVLWIAVLGAVAAVALYFQA